jgi:bifunctional non-homologous end joining protein LigD
MPLEDYRKKRRFDVTKEPPGAKTPRKRKAALAYVIQKHRATALHYDFRLEWNGVLLSWAVPKGPSLDPSVKRMATHVEDHPLEYAAFEGIIPAGEYGGGTVMVWDRGTWSPESPDVDAALEKGELKFSLSGEKLKGSWVLVRMKGWGSPKRSAWLLIKHRDDFASAEEIAESEPRSVISNRLLTEIAIDEGGDVEKASTGDPVGEVEKLLASPKNLARARKKTPSVWHSNRSVAENVKSEEHVKISEKGNRDQAQAPPKRGRSSRRESEPKSPSKKDPGRSPLPKRGESSTRASRPKPLSRKFSVGRPAPERSGSPSRASAARHPSEKSPSSSPSSSPSRPSFPVPVSNPDKVFWPEEKYTKADLVAFYQGIFPLLKPFVLDRPLSLERCPDGMGGECFYQKEKPAGMPKDTPTIPVKHDRGITNTVVGGKLETQLALANLGCIAVHAWNSRVENLDRPDWVCFDLDPDSGEMVDAVSAALKVKLALDALDLRAFVKTSGGKGLHIFLPIRPGPDTREVTWFAKELATRLTSAYPKELTVEMRIAARKGRVFLDSFRNALGQTVVTPYSVRRRPHAPVSAPLEWSEVKTSLKAADYNMGNFAGRLRKRDPWAGFFRSRQSLKNAMEALKRL